MTVAAGEEQVQQCVEALGEILHMLAHGTRHVHQAEHDSLRDGLGMMLIATIAQIDGIDVGNEPTAALQPIALLPQPHEHIGRSEEHTSDLQSLLSITYAVFCL